MTSQHFLAGGLPQMASLSLGAERPQAVRKLRMR
jgi:hypothetical protein